MSYNSEYGVQQIQICM